MTFSSVLTDKGAVQIGQLKQFLAHLQSSHLAEIPIPWLTTNSPITLTPHHTTRRLEQTIRAIPTHNLLRYTSRTLDLMAIFTVEKLFRRIEREVGTRRSRVECLFLFFILHYCSLFVCPGSIGVRFLGGLSRSAFPGRVGDCSIGAGAGNVGIGEWTRHVEWLRVRGDHSVSFSSSAGCLEAVGEDIPL